MALRPSLECSPFRFGCSNSQKHESPNSNPDVSPLSPPRTIRCGRFMGAMAFAQETSAQVSARPGPTRANRNQHFEFEENFRGCGGAARTIAAAEPEIISRHQRQELPESPQNLPRPLAAGGQAGAQEEIRRLCAGKNQRKRAEGVAPVRGRTDGGRGETGGTPARGVRRRGCSRKRLVL